MPDFTWWNLIPTHFDGIALQLGSFPVHWYGLMYLFAFATCYMVIWKTNQKHGIGIRKEQLDSFVTWVIAGILIGARLGYVFFYNPSHYLTSPLEIISPFRYDSDLGFTFVGISGMSYHGGHRFWNHRDAQKQIAGLGNAESRLFGGSSWIQLGTLGQLCKRRTFRRSHDKSYRDALSHGARFATASPVATLRNAF